MLIPYKEIVRAARPLINYDIEKIKSILKVGLELLVPEESDEVVELLTVSTAHKLISDATLEIAYRN